MKNDVCYKLALEKRITFITLPFHKQWIFDERLNNWNLKNIYRTIEHISMQERWKVWSHLGMTNAMKVALMSNPHFTDCLTQTHDGTQTMSTLDKSKQTREEKWMETLEVFRWKYKRWTGITVVLVWFKGGWWGNIQEHRDIYRIV